MLKPSFYNMFSKVCLFVLQFSSTKNFTKFHQNQDQVCEISFPACVRKTGLSIIISSVRGVRSIFVFSLCNIYVGINVCGDIVWLVISYGISPLNVVISRISREVCNWKRGAVFIPLSYGTLYLTFLHLKWNINPIVICCQYFLFFIMHND